MPSGSSRKVRARSALLLVASGFVLATSAPACGSNLRAPLIFEFAPTTACNLASESPPENLQYYTLRVCLHEGTRACIPLVDPGAEHGTPGSETIGIRRDGGGRFTVDAQVDRDALYDVTVYAYEGEEGGTCQPSAVGRSLGVRFGRDPVRVRLHAFDAWTCAGVHEGSSPSLPRGLHQAVLLPNGEVLVVGGVTAPSATAAATGFGAPIAAQTAVVVFDTRDSRFHPVEVEDEDGQPGIARVMFEARFVDTAADGSYEVRLFGGFDPRAAGSGGIGFDSTAITSDQSALYGPVVTTATETAFRSDATLLYDPVTRRATLEPVRGAAPPCATTAATDGPGPVAAVCSIASVAMGMRPRYELANDWYAFGQTGRAMMAGRIGASITELSSTRYLVWGGDVASPTGLPLADAAAARSIAGEVVAMTEDTAVPGHDPATVPDDGRPWTTGYHTATRIAGPAGAVSILFVGGIVPGGLISPFAVPTMTPAGDSFTVALFGPDGAFRSGQRVAAPATGLASVLHTATPLSDDRRRVLVVGGAEVDDMVSPAATLFEVPTVGMITYDEAMSTYAWSEVTPLRAARWGHTTTVIPGYGVLVIGGLTRDGLTVAVIDSAEMLLEDDLPNGTPRPPSSSCESPPDSGVARDAGRRDSGAPRDGGPPSDTGSAMDAGIDGGP